jgi:hypothetical protein
VNAPAYVQCPFGGKASYASKADAKAALRLVRRRGEPLVRVYCCACGAWHVTSKARR